MESKWLKEFEKRLAGVRRSGDRDGVPISIKIRIKSGCFHREHSPAAYQIIDHYVQKQGRSADEFRIEEHENGPEVLTTVQIVAGVLTLSAAAVNVVTAIINARSAGIRKGDGAAKPVYLVVRTVQEGELKEKEVLEIPFDKTVDSEAVRQELEDAINVIAADRIARSASDDVADTEKSTND